MEDFAPVQVRLDYFGGTAGTYAGLDRFGRVRRQRWVDYAADANRDLYGYGYDYNSNRTYRENPLSPARGELYAHDALDRLTNSQRGTLNGNKDGITGTVAREESFTLDDVGNWSLYVARTDGATDLWQTRTHDLANELVAFGQDSGQPHWADPNLDAAGNMIGIPKPSDMTGKFACVYDAWNRLVAVREAGDNSLVATYTYDGLNRRIRKVVASPSAMYDCYYDASWRLLEARKGGTLHEQYVWSERYIDSPVLRDRNADPNESTGGLGKTGSGLDERLYYLTDAQMNVTALLDGTPGSQTLGSAVERYAYDPYGRVTVFDGSWNPRTPNASLYENEVLYCGYRLDTETGLYHVRNRMYHPLLGRWVQWDLIGYAGGPNLYAYCSAGPLTATDPLGLTEEERRRWAAAATWIKRWYKGNADERYHAETLGAVQELISRNRLNEHAGSAAHRESLRREERLREMVKDRLGEVRSTVVAQRDGQAFHQDIWLLSGSCTVVTDHSQPSGRGRLPQLW